MTLVWCRFLSQYYHKKRKTKYIIKAHKRVCYISFLYRKYISSCLITRKSWNRTTTDAQKSFLFEANIIVQWILNESFNGQTLWCIKWFLDSLLLKVTKMLRLLSKETTSLICIEINIFIKLYEIIAKWGILIFMFDRNIFNMSFFSTKQNLISPILLCFIKLYVTKFFLT